MLVYKVRNNLTQKEYLLFGKALVQQSRDSASVRSIDSNKIVPEYTHGVLLYSLDDHLPVVVPYSIFEDEDYSELTGHDIPVWEVVSAVDSFSVIQESLPALINTEVLFHEEWAEKLRLKLPFICNAMYKKEDESSVGAEAVRLMYMDYDTSFGADDPRSLCAALDEEGVIQQPVFIPTRDFVRQYRCVIHNKGGEVEVAGSDLFKLTSESKVEATEPLISPGSVYYCGQDKKEYTFLGLYKGDGSSSISTVALFVPRESSALLPFIGIQVDPYNPEAIEEVLFKTLKDYGDGINRPFLTYVGDTKATAVVNCI